MNKTTMTMTLLLALLLLTGCKKEENKTVSMQIRNLSFLYQFEAIPGSIKSTHQTIYEANGDKRYDGVFNFDKAGCVISFDVSNQDSGHTSVRREKDRLIGEENGKPVMMKLDSQCNVLSKTRDAFTIDVGYNNLGQISTLSSAQSDYRVELTYDAKGRVVGQQAFIAKRQTSQGVQKYAADADGKPSDSVTTSKTSQGTRETTTSCNYQQAVPLTCHFIIKTQPENTQIERYAQLDTVFH